MKIRTMLISGSIVMAVLPVAITALVLCNAATNQSRIALESQAQRQLISIRDAKKDQIETLFKRIENQIITLAKSQTVLTVLQARFRLKNHNEKPPENLDTMRAELVTLYEQLYGEPFRHLNPGEQLDIRSLISKMAPMGVALQHNFASHAKFTLEDSASINEPTIRSSYSSQHETFHPVLQDYANRFGFLDVYVVEPDEGLVVYSRNKWLEYGTSLLDGPLAGQPIGQVFAQALDVKREGEIVFRDFAPYSVNLNRPTAFLAVPVYNAKRIQGVLILSMSSASINRIMTYGNRWKDAGLGDSGETYLIGTDQRMRNDSRFLVETPDSYFELVSSTDLAPDTLSRIKSHGTTVGLQMVDTSSAKRSLNNETGFQIIDDYRGIPVLSAFAPVQVLNQTWGIMTEIDVDEMSLPQRELTQSILLSALGASGVSIVLSILVGLGLALYVTKRLASVTSRMREIAQGSGDLSSRLAESGSDEISELAINFNLFTQKIRNVIDLVCNSSQSLSHEAEQMSEHSKTTQTTVDTQQQKILNIATAIEEMSKSMDSIATNTSAATESARQAQSAANQGNEVVAQTVTSINALAQNVGSAASTVERLAEESKNIESVLSIINGISEQTNLLALNAAIEAARAGESGRGFAVVADEVRSLSVQIQQETAYIGGKISQLQTEANDTVNTIKASHEAADNSVTAAERAGEELQSILQSIQVITDMTSQIASGVEGQNNNSTLISNHVVSIKEQAQQASQAAGVATRTSYELSLTAGQLEEIVQEVLLSETTVKPEKQSTEDDSEDDILF